MQRHPWPQAVAKAFAIPDIDQVNQSFEKVAFGLRDTHSKLDIVICDVDRARQQLGEVIEFAGGAEERLRALERRTGDLFNDFQEMVKATQDLEQRLCRIERLADELVEWRQESGRVLEKADSGMRSMGERVADIDGAMEAVRHRMDEYWEAICRLDRRIDALKAKPADRKAAGKS